MADEDEQPGKPGDSEEKTREEPEVGETLQALLSEFFVQVVSRLIPGSILFVLYFKGHFNADASIGTGFFGITMLLCVVWLSGTALDKATFGVFYFFWFLGKSLTDWKWLAELKCFLCRRSHAMMFWLVDWSDPNHPHITKQLPASQRQSLISVCDKIMFRTVGVIFLLVYFIPPEPWPLKLGYDSPSPLSVPLLRTMGKFCAFMGGGICLICWVALQGILNRAEKKAEDDEKRAAEKVRNERGDAAMGLSPTIVANPAGKP